MRRVRTVEKFWAWLLTFAIAFAWITASMAFLAGAMGMDFREGEFVLLNGKELRPLGQTVGLIYHLVARAAVATALLGVVTALAVYLRNGTVRLANVARESPDEACVQERLISSILRLSWVPLAALLLRLSRSG